MPLTRKQIGDLLVDNGVITQEELDLAKAEHDSTGESIASILRRLGLAGDSQLKNTLELEFGVNFVSLTKFTLDYSLLKMVPLEVVRDHLLVPISHEGNRLTLAMVDPSDSGALDSLQASMAGLQIKPVVCLEEDFLQFIPDSHKPPPEEIAREVKSNGSGATEAAPDGKNGTKAKPDQAVPKPEETPAVQAQAELQQSIKSAKAAVASAPAPAPAANSAPAAASAATATNLPAVAPVPVISASSAQAETSSSATSSPATSAQAATSATTTPTVPTAPTAPPAPTAPATPTVTTAAAVPTTAKAANAAKTTSAAPAPPPTSQTAAAVAEPPLPAPTSLPTEDVASHPPQMGEEIENALGSAIPEEASDNSLESSTHLLQIRAANSSALKSEGIYAAHGDIDGALLSHALSPEHSLTMDPDTWTGGLSSMATDISTGHGTLSEEAKGMAAQSEFAVEANSAEEINEFENATEGSMSPSAKTASDSNSPTEEQPAAMDFSITPDGDDSDSTVLDDIPHAASLTQKLAEVNEAKANELHAAAHDNTASIVDTGSFPAIKDIRNKYEREEPDSGTFPTVTAEVAEVEDEAESDSELPSQDQIEVDLARRAQEEAIVLLANQILGSAIKRQCSNIHISPGERQAIVQYRLNGALYVDRRLPTTILEALIARYKMMARMSLSERQIPQDGHIKVKSSSKEIVCLMSTVPSSNGEHIVIWIV